MKAVRIPLSLSLSLKSPAGTSQKPDKSQPRCCSNLSNSLSAVGIKLSVTASIPPADLDVFTRVLTHIAESIVVF